MQCVFQFRRHWELLTNLGIFCVIPTQDPDISQKLAVDRETTLDSILQAMGWPLTRQPITHLRWRILSVRGKGTTRPLENESDWVDAIDCAYKMARRRKAQDAEVSITFAELKVFSHFNNT